MEDITWPEVLMLLGMALALLLLWGLHESGELGTFARRAWFAFYARFIDRGDYVNHAADDTPVPPRSHEETVPVPVPVHGGNAERRLLSADDIQRLERKARDAGAAEALGLVLGLGLVSESERTALMEALYGPRGRRWQEAKTTLEAAKARSTPPERTEPPIRVSSPEGGYELERG